METETYDRKRVVHTVVALDMTMTALMASLASYPQIRNDMNHRFDKLIEHTPDDLKGIADALRMYKNALTSSSERNR
jgi:hypothetical protein